MFSIRAILRSLYLLVVLLGYQLTAKGQDTLRITLPQAEKFFLKYNIDAQRALILQAKAYPNPNFAYSVGIYNTNSHRYFDFSSNGEQIAQLNQLVLLAGKRNQNIAIAKTNVFLAEHDFLDLLRTL